jgi:hypothetical protein
MDGTGDHHVKSSKAGSKRQRSYLFLHMCMWKVELQGINAYKNTYMMRERTTDNMIVMVGLSQWTSGK